MRLPAFWLSRRGKWIVTGSVVVLVAWASLAWVTRRRVYRTVASSEAMLDQAGLVRGARVERVVAALDSMHATYSPPGSDGRMRAVLGPSFQDLFVSGDIAVEFTFDTAGRLIARQVRERLTGP